MLGVGTVGTEVYIFQLKSSAGSKRDYEIVQTENEFNNWFL